MVQIYREGFGTGIGHTITELHERFEEICLEYIEAKRAKAFALIFYNFRDTELQNVLEDHGAFTRLDRLCGKQLSVFYLNAAEEKVTNYFNSHYLNKFGLAAQVDLPCVVFFRMRDGVKSEFLMSRLHYANNEKIVFHELYTAIENYLKKEIGE